MMALIKMHCGRALPDWGPEDGSSDVVNTELLHDVAEVVFRNATTPRMQAARHARNPGGEPEWDDLPPAAQAALGVRRGNIQAALATFPGGTAPARGSRR